MRPFLIPMDYRPPPISVLRFGQVQSYNLSDDEAEVGLIHVLSEYAFSRKYSFFFSFAIVSSAATPAALSVFWPHSTITTSTLSMRRFTFSFQSPVRCSLTELSLKSKGLSGSLA